MEMEINITQTHAHPKISKQLFQRNTDTFTDIHMILYKMRRSEKKVKNNAMNTAVSQKKSPFRDFTLSFTPFFPLFWLKKPVFRLFIDKRRRTHILRNIFVEVSFEGLYNFGIKDFWESYSCETGYGDFYISNFI